MYDLIENNKIKIFKEPIYQNGTIVYKDGSLKVFERYEKLPLHTSYYKYPINFIIFLYDKPYEHNILIFNNGMYVGSRRLDDYLNDFNNTKIYDREGNIIKIKSNKCLEKIVMDYIELKDNISIINKRLKRKYIDLSFAKKEIELLESRFKKKWLYKENKKEEYFGALIKCLEETSGDSSEHIQIMIKRYLNIYPRVLENYIKWNETEISDAELLRNEINKIINK